MLDRQPITEKKSHPFKRGLEVAFQVGEIITSPITFAGEIIAKPITIPSGRRLEQHVKIATGS